MNIKKTLENYGITSLYHFTDKENLTSIEKYGLQSLSNIIKLNIDVKHFGAEELSHKLDKTKGLDKYVHISFIKDHPMYYISKSRGNLKNPVWIEFDASILYEKTTLFCDTVANSTNADIFRIDKILDKINLEILTNNKFLSGEEFNIRKNVRKAEIMVLDSISINKIKGITYGK